jgi:leucyl/phenylalanyl-tRNA--protein transferase
MLLWAYERGIFPMAEPRTGRLEFYSPDPRAIIPLDGLHVPRSLARVLRGARFDVRSDTAFEAVIRACAEPRIDREETWLDEHLIGLYVRLHELGHAHSVEAWRDDRLVGGLYGVAIGAAFCGESMFSHPEEGGTDASKVCLVHLVERLQRGGFRLLDTQFSTPHLERLGCIEIPREEYLKLLERAIAQPANWGPC